MKPRILIVDDNAGVRNSLAALLERVGYTPIIAANAADAKARLDEQIVHLALIDVRLVNDEDPNDRTGLELCEKIDSCVPKIILTGNKDWEVVRDALAPVHGNAPLARAFFHKTEKPQTLLAEIERVLADEYEVIAGQRIAILTSGGDAPGMNAAIWSALRTALARGVEMYAVYDGYDGLLRNDIQKLRWKSVADALTTGGTMLGSARCDKFRKEEERQPAVENLRRKHITGLIVIGGDGSMQGAEALAADVAKSGALLHTVALPGTIDNDLAGTDMSLGASSAVRAVMREIDNMVAPARALRRVFVCEVMGRFSGFLTIEAGLTVGAEALLLPEELVVVAGGKGDQRDWQSHVEIDETVQAVLKELRVVADRLEATFASGKRHAFVLFSEGIRYLTTTKTRTWINAEIVAETLQAQINKWPHAQKPDVRAQVIGYPMRGGSPSRSDMHLGVTLGEAAVDEVLKGTTNMMVGWSESGQCITLTAFDEVVERSNRSPEVKFRERDAWRKTLELQRKLVAPLPRRQGTTT
jgi:6-phosphofructokinase 1